MNLALLTFLSVFLLIGSGGLLLAYREAVLQRLDSVLSKPGGARQSLLQRLVGVQSAASVAKALDGFQRLLPRSPEEVSVAQRRLIWAGYRKEYYIDIFYAAKVIVPLSLVALATLTGAYSLGPFFVYALATGLGFLIPDYFLGNRISARQLKIKLALPEALDLMVICIEAGLGIDQAILRVADELHLSQPELADEFNLLNLEQRAGRPRKDAWKNLADRTDVESVRGLVTMLIQADHFGTSIAKTLRVHSDVLRVKRRQEAEEQAAKTTVKLVFPLVFLIFPSLFVVVLAPSMIKMKDAFEQYLLN